MAVPARTLLSDLPKGHRFAPVDFSLSADDVSHYLDAVEDSNSLYGETGLAPPLAVAARALGALLETVELPAGTLHTGQEVEARAGVPIGSDLTLSGRLAQRSERAGLVVSVIEFEVALAGMEGPALAGRTAVMAPAAAKPEGGR